MDQGSSLGFNFNSQTGVMSLLATIRSSSLTPADKNELRDLVFLYKNGGGDASVRIALEQKLVAHNLMPTTAAPAQTAQPAQDLSFGTSRPAPVFRGVVNQAVAPQPAPVQPQYVPPAPVVPAPQPVAAPQYVPPAPQTAPVAPTPTQPQMTTGSQNYLDRIREIKLAVNTKVGNPVNLVDIDNAVGREYMNALLDAMKRLSGGAPGQIEEAMQRLEGAYKSVEVAVANHAQAQKQAVPVPVAPQPTPVVPFEVQSVQETVVKDTSVPVPAQSSAQNPIPTPTQVPVPTPTPAPQTKSASSPAVPAEEEVSGFALAAEKEAREAALKSILPVPKPPSINNEQKLQTPQDLPLASSLATSESGDPLKTREVDDGLNQLLSDWSLFKKSGLFGTGPKGREHPLFKKLAGLQIPLLLAGRFEGSTQEIKQSITDYMNGWRYEQGIIYEQGETFEHYLRRVIKQILDLQKKHKPA